MNAKLQATNTELQTPVELGKEDWVGWMQRQLRLAGAIQRCYAELLQAALAYHQGLEQLR